VSPQEGQLEALLPHVVVDRAGATLAAASTDFGRIARGNALAVVRPRDVEQLVQVVSAAGERGWRIAVRGGGLSQSGQSVPQIGFSLDLSAFRKTIAQRDGATVNVGAGTTFRELLARLARQGQKPKVMPLNLDLSVGGVLSAGGFGSTSFRHGMVASCVERLEVVSGRGERVRASRSEASLAFHATLGGLGRVGVLVDADIELCPMLPRTRTFYLLYEKLPRLLADTIALRRCDTVEHLEIFCASSILGLRLGPNAQRVPLVHYQYGLQVSSEFGPDQPGLSQADLSPIVGDARLIHVEEDDSAAFAARYDARFAMMHRDGSWQLAHPWFECMLPLQALSDVVPRALAALPVFLGDGHRIMLVSRANKPRAIAFPESEEVAGFAVLPTGVPEPLLPVALGALERVEQMCLDAGGKRYLSGHLFGMNEARWKRHYGEDYRWLAEAKATLDPSGTFQSLLGQPVP
jgi:cytokinin dehydrogenase